jgi:peroxiredoxin
LRFSSNRQNINKVMPQILRIKTCGSLAAALTLLSAAVWAAQEAGSPAEMPPVLLSKQHEALCKVKVGDMLPDVELPRLDNGRSGKLSEMLGVQGTVVIFWTADRRMALEQLADLTPDVIEPFAERGVAVVGIAVNEPASSAQKALQEARADFPNLLDADGRAFATVGSEKLPRTYLLDPQGKILWFDIEYSHATRRELQQALRAITSQQ